MNIDRMKLRHYCYVALLSACTQPLGLSAEQRDVLDRHGVRGDERGADIVLLTETGAEMGKVSIQADGFVTVFAGAEAILTQAEDSFHATCNGLGTIGDGGDDIAAAVLGEQLDPSCIAAFEIGFALAMNEVVENVAEATQSLIEGGHCPDPGGSGGGGATPHECSPSRDRTLTRHAFQWIDVTVDATDPKNRGMEQIGETCAAVRQQAFDEVAAADCPATGVGDVPCIYRPGLPRHGVCSYRKFDPTCPSGTECTWEVSHSATKACRYENIFFPRD